MTTVLLSVWIDALRGFRSAYSAALSSGFRFIPNRQFCLPKRGPRGVRRSSRSYMLFRRRPGGDLAVLRDAVPRFAWATGGIPPVQSLRIGRGRDDPGTSNHSLYRTEPLADPRYPEGNFGVNQLPSGSIGLSPLSARRTNDLHVSTVDGPPPGFPPASPRARIDHRFSGPNARARTRSPPSGRRSVVPPRWVPGVPTSRFRYAAGLSARALARPLDSSVRDTRRVV